MHEYLSTACHHDAHEECRLSCKFCAVLCSCPCHNTVNDRLTEQYTAILESYKAIQANYAAVALDVEKIKTALNIDVEPPPPPS